MLSKPNVLTRFIDPKKKITLEILAYRKVSLREARGLLYRFLQSQRKGYNARGHTIRIVSGLGSIDL